MIQTLQKIRYPKVKLILYIFILVQPLLDLITSLNVRYSSLKFLSLGIVVRTIFMFFLVISILKEKTIESNRIKIYYLALGSYFLVFCIILITNKNASFFYSEIKGLIKSFYFPVVMVALYYWNKKENLVDQNRVFKLVLVQYLLVIFIATITQTSFNSYDYGYGSVGWFFAANEIGAIIAILIPYIILPILRNKWTTLNVSAIVLLFFSIFYIGTKVPPLSLVLYIAIVSLSVLYRYIRYKRYKPKYLLKTISSVFLLSLIFVVKSPLSKNVVSTYGHFFAGNLVAIEEPDQEEITKNAKDKEIEQAILSSRNLYNDLVANTASNAPIVQKLFGIGYNIKGEKGVYTDKMVEMDGYDILYRNGYIGFSLYFLPTLIIGIVLAKKFLSNFTRNFASPLRMSLTFSIIIGLVIGLLTGHVLTSPAVSIYIILTILVLQSVLDGKKYLIN